MTTAFDEAPKQRVWPTAPCAPEDTPFYTAAREGRFLIKQCEDCTRFHWYPRPVCPHCFSLKTHWVEASGQGTVYSHSTMRRVEAPWTLAYVTLAEGPTMMTALVDGPLDDWHIGQPVKLVFKAGEDGTPVPCFEPA